MPYAICYICLITLTCKVLLDQHHVNFIERKQG